MPSLPQTTANSNHNIDNVSDLSDSNNNNNTNMKPIDLGASNRSLSTSIANNQPNQSIIRAGHATSSKLMDLGKKLLEVASKGLIDDVRQLVLNSGAPFTSDWLGTTALHMAAQNGHTEIAEILLKGGVNRDAKTKLERTALHLAALNGRLEVVDLLLVHGSEVNVKDMLKMTPLHWAVDRGHVSVARRLLFGGADVSAKSKFQLTPVDLAQQSERYEMIELFKKWLNDGSNVPLSVPNYNEYLTNYSRLFLNGLSNHCHLNESHKMLDEDFGREQTLVTNDPVTNNPTILDIEEPCFDLIGWNTFEFESDVFLAPYEEDENRVEYLMKVIKELKRENRQLRQRVEQLSTTGLQMRPSFGCL